MQPKIDQDGWAAGLPRILSPNFDCRPDGCKVELAVVHGISLPPGKFGGDEIDRLFTNASEDPQLADVRVSAHFLIRRTGAAVQFVSCNNRAWHAGRSSWRGRSGCNDFSIGIELEGDDRTPYERIQYESLAALLAALQERYRRLAFLAGHSDIAPGRKTDPGPAFDWRRLRSLIGDCLAVETGENR